MQTTAEYSAKLPTAPEEDSGHPNRAHGRPRAPQSPWSLLSAVFCLIGVAGTWIGIAYPFHAYRNSLFPADAFLSSGTRVGNILMYVAPLFPSIAIGFLVGNFLFWCVPPARATLKRGTARPDGGFRATQLGLAKFGAIISLICLPLCLLGANNFWSVTPDRIDYRSMLSETTRHYEWSSVEKIDTACHTGNRDTTYDFVLRLNAGPHIDLMEESPYEFESAYPQIQSALRRSNYAFSSWGMVGTCVANAPRRWREMLLRRPTD